MQETIKKIYKHKTLRLIMYLLGGLFILSATFQLGIFVGYKKASFTRNWGDHYTKNFGMERPDSFRGMMNNKMPMAHGSFGKILTVTLPTFVIEDNDGTEKSIIITGATIIKNGRENASSTSITPDMIVAVMGNPNDQGQIEAKLVRIMPADFGTSTPARGMMHQGTTNYKDGRGMMFTR